MAPPTEGRETGGVPVVVDREAEISGRVGAAVKLAVLETKLESVPTRDQVRAEVTGARAAIERQIRAITPPAFWKIMTGAGVFLLALATIVWQASARVSDLAFQNALLHQQVDTMARDLRSLTDRVAELEKRKP